MSVLGLLGREQKELGKFKLLRLLAFTVVLGEQWMFSSDLEVAFASN